MVVAPESGRCEFVPGLAAQSVSGEIELSQQIERQRIDSSVGMAAGTEAVELSLAETIQNRLG